MQLTTAAAQQQAHAAQHARVSQQARGKTTATRRVKNQQ